MKKFLSCTIVFCLFFMLACEDNTMQPIKKTSDKLQSPTSLEGTVGVHHPDTDPNDCHGFNLSLAPRTSIGGESNPEGFDEMYPSGYNPEIRFTYDMIHYDGIFNGHSISEGQASYYAYDGEVIRVQLQSPVECTCNSNNTTQQCTCGGFVAPGFFGNLSPDGNTMYLHMNGPQGPYYRNVVLVRVPPANANS